MSESKLNPNAAFFIKTVLDFVKINLVELIELEYAKLAAGSVIEKLKATADVLANANVDDKAELKLIWGTFFADPTIAQSLHDALLDAASKIKDENLREGLTLLIEPLVKTVSAISDQDLNNGDQLEKIWLDFLKSEVFLNYAEKNLEFLLDKLIKNDGVVKFIISLLKMFIKNK